LALGYACQPNDDGDPKHLSGVGYGWLRRAELCEARGNPENFEDAITCYDNAIHVLHQDANPLSEARPQARKGRLLARMSRTAEALAAMTRALEILAGQLPYEADVVRAWIGRLPRPPYDEPPRPLRERTIITMADYGSLKPAVYGALAEIMGGPHGQPLTPQSPAGLLVVFSCADPEVGRAAARLQSAGLVERVVFSGNVGKDSAGLPTLGITEAAFLASVAIAEGLPTDVILLEHEARNGAENAAFALRLAAKLGYLPPATRVASLAPAARSRRLYEELRYQASAALLPIDVTAGLSSGTANAADPSIQEELLRELRGLATMHQAQPPRIHQLQEFLEGGKYWSYVRQATPHG
jgi:tetratricopeptide (TPR) repeat protein